MTLRGFTTLGLACKGECKGYITGFDVLQLLENFPKVTCVKIFLLNRFSKSYFWNFWEVTKSQFWTFGNFCLTTAPQLLGRVSKSCQMLKSYIPKASRMLPEVHKLQNFRKGLQKLPNAQTLHSKSLPNAPRGPQVTQLLEVSVNVQLSYFICCFQLHFFALCRHCGHSPKLRVSLARCGEPCHNRLLKKKSNSCVCKCSVYLIYLLVLFAFLCFRGVGGHAKQSSNMRNSCVCKRSVFSIVSLVLSIFLRATYRATNEQTHFIIPSDVSQFPYQVSPKPKYFASVPLLGDPKPKYLNAAAGSTFGLAAQYTPIAVPLLGDPKPKYLCIAAGHLTLEHLEACG